MITPLVALQKPKDISLDEIEAELNAIWHHQSINGAGGATRASTFNMVVYEPEEFQQLLAILGFYEGEIDGIYIGQTKVAVEAAQAAYGLRITGQIDPITLARLREEVQKLPIEHQTHQCLDLRGQGVSDAIAAQNPCRVITLCPTIGIDTGVTAQVSAYCPVHKTGGNLICCEYITLRGTKAALNRVGELVTSLIIPDLPRFVWWKATPNPEQELFIQMAHCCNCIVMDSSYFGDSEAEFLKIQELVESGTYVADLNWHRLAPWQELTAATFDPPERRMALQEVDQIAIDYEKGNGAQALMFLGWFASRMGWHPQSYVETGGEYDLEHIYFTNSEGRPVEAELAGIPVIDSGEISGDLVALRITSTNPLANCCTILCSETSGCMRMEAGGTAQSCHSEQVTATTDQKAEFLLSQQLQRWGREVLYEESLTVTAQLIKLKRRV
ncbi:MAG: glucose-6-phosphate dehydrogenase assembly protein OpcA [Cyanobacteria bacterium REEB444]|nr:glucose-6-phosphate dehydrogenase assembly protein OpcA [Cyanobacteria bacterium REEB444]